MENSDNTALSILSREKLDQVTTWMVATVSSAFFSSLERFSCVNVATDDTDDDEGPLSLLSHQAPLDLHERPDQADGFVDLPV